MDLFKVRWTFRGLLLLICVLDFWTSAADPTCTYNDKIDGYYVYRLAGYSWRGGHTWTNCKWHIYSDTRVRFTCKNRVQNCTIKFVISEGKKVKPVSYCSGSFVHESLGDSFDIELFGPPNIPDGYLNCEFEAVACRCGWKKPAPYESVPAHFVEDNTPRDVHHREYNVKSTNNTRELQNEPEISNAIADSDSPVGLKKSNHMFPNNTRIVGGVPTLINEYPMMAGIIDRTNKLLFCGATIISPRYLVTAAHCLMNKYPDNLAILVGDYDLSTDLDTKANDIFPVDDYSIHPNYKSPENYFDIALVKVDGFIEITWEVGPACLPFQRRRFSFDNEYVTMLGWGTTSFGGNLSKVLQKVTVKVVNYYDCRESYPFLRGNQICTYADGKDACQFDSGGPVLWQDPSTGRVALVGIISYGLSCAGNTPSINTRITETLQWIEQMTPEVLYCRAE